MRKFLAVTEAAHQAVLNVAQRTGVSVGRVSSRVLENALKEKTMSGMHASRLYQGINLKDTTVTIGEVADLYNAPTFEEFLLLNNIRIID